MKYPCYECQNCGKRYQGIEDVPVQLEEVPDLLQRIAPGERVPAGECGECGAVVHERKGAFSSPRMFVVVEVGSDEVLCWNDDGKLVEIGTNTDHDRMMLSGIVDVVKIHEDSIVAILGEEWGYEGLLGGLSAGTLVVKDMELVKGSELGFDPKAAGLCGTWCYAKEGHVVIRLKPEVLAEVERLLGLDLPVEGFKTDDVIFTLTADLGKGADGAGMQADIKFCNGDTGPWVDAVLFRNGCEVQVLEPSDRLEGEYPFALDGRMYLVDVRAERASE